MSNSVPWPRNPSISPTPIVKRYDSYRRISRRYGALHRRRHVTDKPSRACCWNASKFWFWAKPSTPSRSEEHTSELQSLMRISYAVFCLKKKIDSNPHAEHFGLEAVHHLLIARLKSEQHTSTLHSLMRYSYEDIFVKQN